MNYCENCRLLTVEPRCPVCAAALRPVRDTDYCSMGVFETPWLEMLREILENNGIEPVLAPRRWCAPKFYTGRDGMEVFTAYRDLSAAQELLGALMNGRAEPLPEDMEETERGE